MQTAPTNPQPSGRAHAQALAERRRKRTRRRLAAWGAFLLLGLMLGAIYATGFATIGGAVGEATDPETNKSEPALNEDGAELAEQIEPVTANLSYEWAGRWGSIASAAMYEIDLTEFEAAESFFSEVVLLDPPSGFSDLQLQLRIAKLAAPATESCAANGVTALEGTAESNYRVMVFDTDDAQVTFSGMAGGTEGLDGEAEYCIGIVDYAGPPAAGKDEGGTFIRKAKAGPDASEVEEPTFVGTLNRME